MVLFDLRGADAIFVTVAADAATNDDVNGDTAINAADVGSSGGGDGGG